MVLRSFRRLVRPVRPCAAAVVTYVPRPASFREPGQASEPSPATQIRLGAANIAKLLRLARGLLGEAPEGIATGAAMAIGTGEAAPPGPRRTSAKEGQARATLGLRPTMVGPVRVLPRRLTKGLGPP